MNDLATLLGAALGGGALTFIGRLLLGGTVRQTDADRLWKEASELRDEYKGRVERLEAELAEMRQEMQRFKGWQYQARGVLQECANGNRELAKRIEAMKLLERSA